MPLCSGPEHGMGFRGPDLTRSRGSKTLRRCFQPSNWYCAASDTLLDIPRASTHCSVQSSEVQWLPFLSWLNTRTQPQQTTLETATVAAVLGAPWSSCQMPEVQNLYLGSDKVKPSTHYLRDSTTKRPSVFSDLGPEKSPCCLKAVLQSP